MAIVGGGGKGKTTAAIKIATGIGGKICLVDTENKNATIYSHRFKFDIGEIKRPFEVRKFVDAITQMEKSHDILILDQISSAWEWMLEVKKGLDAGNKSKALFNWNEIAPEYRALRDAIIDCKIHIICVMRGKVKVDMKKGHDGQSQSTEIPISAVQRKDLKFEFDLVFKINDRHLAYRDKDKTDVFGNLNGFEIGKGTGEQIKKWLDLEDSGPPEKEIPILKSLAAYGIPDDCVDYMKTHFKNSREAFQFAKKFIDIESVKCNVPAFRKEAGLPDPESASDDSDGSQERWGKPEVDPEQEEMEFGGENEKSDN